MMSFIFIIMMISQMMYDKNIDKLVSTSGQSPTITYLIIIGIYIVILLILIVAFILFYRLIYGILIKRLKHNYDELKKINY
jgi:hypothetical protein